MKNEKSSGGPRENLQNHVEFIIGADENDNKRTYTSNPNALANFFGANPGAPNYLTAVHFRKEVLDKYYQKPNRYSVETSVLHCGHEWGLQMDNNHDSKVCAWLGDLGGIPYDEQLHWRAYNIPPDGGLSNTFFRNQILAKPTDSVRPEYLFQRNYDDLQDVSMKFLGWALLFPLNPEDNHRFQILRIPSSSEQREFDELILSLAKILVDSLNENQLKKFAFEEDLAKFKGSIDLLESVFEQNGVADYSDHISFLRKL